MLRAAVLGHVDILGISCCNGNVDAVAALNCAKALPEKVEQRGTPITAPVSAAQSVAKLERGTIPLARRPLTNIASAVARAAGLRYHATPDGLSGVLSRWKLRRRLFDLNI